jgi:DNA repair exonuclease SbcCD ATPase subunit
MKKIMFFVTAMLLMMVALPTIAQKYKSASDTVKLNKEWVEVSNDIAELQAKLTIAQNNLPGYTSKVGDAVSNAQNAAEQSSQQAYKATNGDLGDAKDAKKKAKKALNEAEDAQSAKDKVKDQEKKIDKLTSELQKKQKQLSQLEEMRTTIRSMHQ